MLLRFSYFPSIPQWQIGGQRVFRGWLQNNCVTPACFFAKSACGCALENSLGRLSGFFIFKSQTTLLNATGSRDNRTPGMRFYPPTSVGATLHYRL